MVQLSDKKCIVSMASYKELELLQYLLLITDMCPDIFAKHDKRILQSMKESKSTTQTL